MFQSFTGSSRRPRQVNLSGRNNNPFTATSSPRHPSLGQIPHNAVSHAQQERILRQQERDRLQAARTFQRIWRGKRSRQKLRNEYRHQWDVLEGISRESIGEETRTKLLASIKQGAYGSQEEVLTQLNLLLQFAAMSNDQDVQRTRHFVNRFRDSLPLLHNLDTDKDWIYPLLKLFKVSASILCQSITSRSPCEDTIKDLLGLFIVLARAIPTRLALQSVSYFHTIRVLLLHPPTNELMQKWGSESIQALTCTLLNAATVNTMAAYRGFLSEIFTIAELQSLLAGFEGLVRKLNYAYITTALQSLLSPPDSHSQGIFQSKSVSELLWLLSYFIYCSQLSTAKDGTTAQTLTADYILTISAFLSELSVEITTRMDPSAKSNNSQLPTFVWEQISSLVNQQNVTSLLSRSNMVATSPNQNLNSDTAALASYALTLLQVFPRRADEIRMWLYLGSTAGAMNNSGASKNRVPAIRYFWDAVTRTVVYTRIVEHPKNAIELLRIQDAKLPVVRSINEFSTGGDRDREWRVLLLFLELYTFVLKVMDDEEFMSGGSPNSNNQSWTRQSALEITQVKDLTVFLKNLSFAMYYNIKDLPRSDGPSDPNALASYFNATNSTTTTNRMEEPVRVEDLQIAGMFGTSLNYMKGMVTGLLRMIYERDSRRSFLPRDHWLMTKYFDMEGFIPAVVSEEDYRHQIHDKEDTADEDTDQEFEEEDNDDDMLIGTHRTQQLRRIERLRQQQRKVARRKQLESVTPRLEILQNMPFFIPFDTRVKIFREFVTLDQVRRRHGYVDADQWRLSVMQNSPGIGPDGRRVGYDNLSKHHAKVRRDNVFDDAYEQFYQLNDGLKEPIQITFVDQFDTVEAGIDGGGVTKEFLTSITNEAFTPSTQGSDLFVENDQHLLYPNPAAFEERKDVLRQMGFVENTADFNEPLRDLSRRYEFLGRIVGKCLYEGILIDIHFAPFFLVKWALTGGTGSAPNESSYRANINDLRDLDEGLYQGLLQLKNYSGNVEDFSLDFTITDTYFNKTITRNLRPGGAELPVTNENRLVYISYVARHRLQIQPHQQTAAFLRGLGTMIQPSWLSMFNQSELQTLIGGDSSEINIPDLRRNTLYGGVYAIGDDNEEHPTVKMFWEAMQGFSDADRRKVLKYVTSTPRAPLLGFSQLNPRFSLRDSGSDQERLPSTSTCVNLLKLPIYADLSKLQAKLLYAVNAGAGFNLS